MNNFSKTFGRLQSAVIGMIHVKALPGTPCNTLNVSQIIEDSCEQAKLYKQHDIVSFTTFNIFRFLAEEIVFFVSDKNWNY